MHLDQTVAIVVPAYNEDRFIASMLRRIPAWVDRIIVVDDCSRDRTHAEASAVLDPRIRVVRHASNRGVGGAILTGYLEFLAEGLDIAVVMAGDGQMDPADLADLVSPVAQGRADYAKGNRFLRRDTWRAMPPLRLAGNLGLSFLTRVASGYSHIMDSQCGYTAVSAAALRRVDLSNVYPRYGFPNDLLAHLHTAGARVAQIPVRAVYEGQPSGISPLLAVFPLSWVLLRSWLLRRKRENGLGASAMSEKGGGVAPIGGPPPRGHHLGPACSAPPAPRPSGRGRE